MMSQQVHPALANETDDTTVQVRYPSQIADTALQQTSKSYYTTSRNDVCQVYRGVQNKAMSITFYSIYQVYISYIPYIPHIAGRSGFLSSLNKPVGR